jgi:hypothetical protein
MKAVILFSSCILAVLAVSPAPAVVDPELACITARYQAAAKYALCQEKAKGTYSIDDIPKALVAASKCRIKYAAKASSLQEKYPATACDVPRFVDNADGTVTDNLTGLVWEQKTSLDGSSNAADPHDADNKYSWTSGTGNEDGTAFTDFLATLNAGGGFAGSNGWRLPTLSELQTILLPEPLPCATHPCIEAVFGPTIADDDHWTATSSFVYPSAAWTVQFYDGDVSDSGKAESAAVRAVRGGL